MFKLQTQQKLIFYFQETIWQIFLLVDKQKQLQFFKEMDKLIFQLLTKVLEEFYHKVVH